MGYHITMDKPPSRIKTLRLPNDPFCQSNGYKPAPLDLANVTLSSKLEELVDQLAENTHNVWAKDRIAQGWTYGLNEVYHSIVFLLLFSSLMARCIHRIPTTSAVLIWCHMPTSMKSSKRPIG